VVRRTKQTTTAIAALALVFGGGRAAQAQDVRVKVNDVQVVSWTKPADFKKDITAGTFALQAHDPNSTVYYKNIRVKPLD